MKKVYIDGQAGTTGLQIRERLENRTDIQLLTIDEDKRHDNAERRRLMAEADLVFLCLPDEAAREAAIMAKEEGARIIDASTAHRTQWVYGFPELDKDQKNKIRHAQKVANPGCHATGFIAIAAPLVRSGLVSSDARFAATSLTGYTGGGKKMIRDYETSCSTAMKSPKPYSLGLSHKHLPEMKKICGLETSPIFVPIVDDYLQGMLVMVPLTKDITTASAGEIVQLYKDWYKDTDIEVMQEEPSLFANALAGTDKLTLHVTGNEQGVLVCALFDNLGKGASGAAVANMNLMLGLDEKAGLHL